MCPALARLDVFLQLTGSGWAGWAGGLMRCYYNDMIWGVDRDWAVTENGPSIETNRNKPSICFCREIKSRRIVSGSTVQQSSKECGGDAKEWAQFRAVRLNPIQSSPSQPGTPARSSINSW
jgi:hypothetical protein